MFKTLMFNEEQLHTTFSNSPKLLNSDEHFSVFAKSKFGMVGWGNGSALNIHGESIMGTSAIWQMSVLRQQGWQAQGSTDWMSKWLSTTIVYCLVLMGNCGWFYFFDDLFKAIITE